MGSDTSIAGHLAAGRAYEYAANALLNDIENRAVQDEVVGILSQALRMISLVCITFCGLGFLSTFLENEIKLRDTLETGIGIKGGKKDVTVGLPSVAVDVMLAAVQTTREPGSE